MKNWMKLVCVGFVVFSVGTGAQAAVRKPAPAVCGAIFEKDIADKVINGAVVVAGDVNGIDTVGAWGWADEAHKFPMTTRTVIDVASVTKASAGVTAFLVAHARGLVDFDAPFTNYLTSYSAPLTRRVTVRDLANHRSGFGETEKKGRPYFDPDPKRMMAKILSLPPGEPSATKVHYACRNYVLLGQTLEKITGRPLAEFCRQEIFAPIGMTDTAIGAPLPSVEPTRLAQTTGTPRAGMISDFVARPLWPAGYGTFNAGLFTTAEDLAKLLGVYLRGGVTERGTRLFGAAELAQIAPSTTNRLDGARSFGWMSHDASLPPALFGTALYHSGWSGQTVLMDFARKRFAVVLTTRRGDYDRAKRNRFKAIAVLMNVDD